MSSRVFLHQRWISISNCKTLNTLVLSGNNRTRSIYRQQQGAERLPTSDSSRNTLFGQQLGQIKQQQTSRFHTSAAVTMRAQVLEKFNTAYALKTDFPKPGAPKGYEVLVRVLAASYCHTDAVFASGAMWQDLPRVGSHEFAGVVEELGPDAEKAEGLGLKKGQLVGVPGRAFASCGACYECTHNDGDRPGYGVWCPSAGNLGLSRDGGFQEWCLADARQIAPVPEGLKAVDVAPLMCAGVTIFSALENGGIHPSDIEANKGKTVAIIGAGGGLGHLGVQFASKLGCDVLAVDVGGALKMIEEVVDGMGSTPGKVTIVDATENVDSTKKKVFGEAEKGREGEKGCDVSLILPEAQAAFDYGMAILKNHSICVCVSFPKEGWHFQPRDLVFRHITMTGVLVGRNRQLRGMLKFAAENGVRAKIRTYALEDLNTLVDDYHKGAGGKLVVDMEKKA